MPSVAAVPPTTFSPADILTPAELAARLKVKKIWVYEQMRPGRKNPLPAMRAGKFLRFSWPAVCAWLQGTTASSAKMRGKKVGARA